MDQKSQSEHSYRWFLDQFVQVLNHIHAKVFGEYVYLTHMPYNQVGSEIIVYDGGGRKLKPAT